MRYAPVVDKELPRDDSYDADRVARAYWRVSYKTGRGYGRAADATGKPMLWPHEREQSTGYDRRLRTTKPRNHAGPIIRRYNDFVFRTPATRPESGGDLYETLVEDADGKGTPIDRFMRRACGVAQIEREVYILPDSTKPAEAGEVSQAQASEAGYRPVLRLINADAVVWTYRTDGVLEEAVAILVREDGTSFARWYGPKSTLDIEITKPDEKAGTWPKVVSIGDEVAHEYGACPLVPLRPLFDTMGDDAGEAQIHPLAEAQQAIFNYQSLLNEELFNVCFSQVIATGVSADQVKDVAFGSSRMLCLPSPQAGFEVIGADPAQAESLRKSISDEERELYRVAGIQTGDPLASPGDAESGVAKAFRFNDLAANLSALADACEDAENGAMQRVFHAQGEAMPGTANYPEEFDLPVMADELSDTIRVVSVQQIPDVIKKHMIQRFADRSLGLSEEEDAELKTALDEFETPDPTDPFAGAPRVGS